MLKSHGQTLCISKVIRKKLNQAVDLTLFKPTRNSCKLQKNQNKYFKLVKDYDKLFLPEKDNLFFNETNSEHSL